jgi:hypothetical protein
MSIPRPPPPKPPTIPEDLLAVLEAAKGRYLEEMPPYIPLSEVAKRFIGLVIRRRRAPPVTGVKAKILLLWGAERFEDFCESEFPPVDIERLAMALGVRPEELISIYASQKGAVKGIRDYVESYAEIASEIASKLRIRPATVHVPPMNVRELLLLLRAMFSGLRAEDSQDLLHALETGLLLLDAEDILTPPGRKGAGGLMKLGFYLHKKLTSYTQAAEKEAVLEELIPWILSIIWRYEKPPEAITISDVLELLKWSQVACREAAYVAPWIKLWVLTALASYRCEEFARHRPSLGLAAELIAEDLVLAGLIEINAAIAIEEACPVTWIAPIEALLSHCRLLRGLTPTYRYLKYVYNCYVRNAVATRCRRGVEEYVGRVLRRSRTTVDYYTGVCMNVMEAIFTDPMLLKRFVAHYIYAESPFEDGFEFRLPVREATGVSRAALRIVLASLRHIDEIPAPAYMRA